MTLPPERFYWAVLEAPGPHARWALGRAREQRLGYSLEPLLPVPLESVQAVYRRLADGRVLACAVDAAVAHEAAAGGAEGLWPRSLPAFLGGVGVDAADLDLLTGRYEPAPVRARRARRVAHASAAILSIAALVATGLERRVRVAGEEARRAEAVAAEVVSRVLPGPSAQPPELRLVGELRRLRQTRAPAEPAEPDASPVLAALLGAWPREFGGRVESLVVTPQTVSLTAAVGDHGAAQELAASVGLLPGWKAEQPQARADRDGVRVTLRLTRSREEGP